jgi:hypothetical protein
MIVERIDVPPKEEIIIKINISVPNLVKKFSTSYAYFLGRIPTRF